MVTKIDPGQLYIVTELDAATNATTGYYKIGIVRNDRETADRIKKFQTGNPNRVVPQKVFETEAPMFIERTCCMQNLQQIRSALNGLNLIPQPSSRWFRGPLL